jgi:hypothetical protein
MLHSIKRLGLQRRCNVSCEGRTEFYIPEDGILHSHCRVNLKSYRQLQSLNSLPGQGKEDGQYTQHKNKLLGP